jgi:hypothetical protein
MPPGIVPAAAANAKKAYTKPHGNNPVSTPAINPATAPRVRSKVPSKPGRRHAGRVAVDVRRRAGHKPVAFRPCHTSSTPAASASQA